MIDAAEECGEPGLPPAPCCDECRLPAPEEPCCGDAACALGENCLECPADCGGCPAPNEIFIERLGVCGGNAPCYSAAQPGFAAALGGFRVFVSADQFGEDLDLDLEPGETMTLSSSWTPDFGGRHARTLTVSSGAIVATTTLQSVVVRGGTLRLE